MSLCSALGKLCALTGIDTFVGLASQSVMAVRVYQALVLPAPIVRISPVTLQTRTVGSVKSRVADGVLAARLVKARILALSVIAGQGRFTFAVALASSWSRCFNEF